MRMFIDNRSNAGALLSGLQGAQQKALTAMAYPVYNAVKRSLRHGYHSSLGNWGNFVTGNSLNHVTVSPVKQSDDGASISVGTDLLYPLYWELGHHNLFTRHFERDEKWAPAYEATKQEAFAAYARVFGRAWRGSSGVQFSGDIPQSLSFGSGEGVDIE